MGAYEKYNAENVLENVNRLIENIDNTPNRRYRIRFVCDELSIFDWWNENLSKAQLKAMKAFLEEAIKLGYNGYVCFKVGAKYCASGMWAHKSESTNGYSPDGACIYRSFQSSGNYWDACDDNGVWMHPECEIKTARQLEKAIESM